MNMKMSIAFGIGNLFVFLIIIAMFRFADAQTHVPPTPVYAGWKTIEGPAFSGSVNPNGISYGLTHHLDNWTFILYDWSTAGTFMPSGDYTQLSFVSSTLNLTANNSEPTVIALGTYSFEADAYVINGTEFYAKSHVKPDRIIGNTTFLDISLIQDYKLLSDPQNTIRHVEPYGSINSLSDPNAYWYLGYASYPCVMWQDKSNAVQCFSLTLPNGTVLYYYPPPSSVSVPPYGIFWWKDYPDAVRSFALQYNVSVVVEYEKQEASVQLNWSYAELWKYMPIDHYDNSTAIVGIHFVSELPIVGLTVALCDVILLCVLLTLPQKKINGESIKPVGKETEARKK